MEPEDLNSQLEKLYHSAEAASQEGLVEEAIKRCETALELLDLNMDEESSFTHSDFLMVGGSACWLDGDIEGAERYYRQAHVMDPGRLDAIVAMGVALFHLARFAASRQFLELATVEDHEASEGWYYLGLLSLREGRRELAEIYFTRANEQEPERWLLPKFLSLDEIEGILEEFLGQLPKEIRSALDNVPVILDDRPTDEMLHHCDPPLDPLLLGVFEGTPLPEQSVFESPTAPTQIILFAENIALIAPDENKLREELAITLKHEIGHYFGLDEDDLAARGLD
ncbi:metallopeptidase family protein [Candidatus Poribacteria bacterium]|nr:metallopeptidase family protein [Candidatus Poribacteria bacterium]